MKTTKEISKEYDIAKGDTSNHQEYLDNLLRIESKRWWSEEEKRQELIELETIREQIAQADSIPNGNHYMELAKSIDKFIEQKRKALVLDENCKTIGK